MAVSSNAYADDCGPDPNECVVTGQIEHGMSGQFSTPISNFMGATLIVSQAQVPIDINDDGAAMVQSCNSGGDQNPGVASFSRTQNSSGSDIGDVIENTTDAVRRYGDQVSANLPDHGPITLSDLLDANGASVYVLDGTLPAGSGKIQQLTTNSFFMTLDFAEIEAQSVISTGSGSAARELYVTFFHELAHIQLGVGTVVDESALNQFGVDMLEAFETKAGENSDNPYEPQECPIDD